MTPGAGTWAVLPAKPLAQAKARLAPVLTPSQRRALASAMLGDVLRALAGVAALEGILVVTRDPAAARIARPYGARILDEGEAAGHTAAVGLAATTLAAEGCRRMLALPGDVPLARPQALRELLDEHPQAPAVTLVPSRDGTGSNAVLCSPPEALPLRFGQDSFPAHRAGAEARGLRCRVIVSAGLALDIDEPQDLLAFLDIPSGTATLGWLQASGLASALRGRPGAARSRPCAPTTQGVSP